MQFADRFVPGGEFLLVVEMSGQEVDRATYGMRRGQVVDEELLSR